MTEHILRLPAVKARIGLSRSSIYSAIASNAFPQPIRLGERAVGWLESDIDRWVESRKALRLRPGGDGNASPRRSGSERKAVCHD